MKWRLEWNKTPSLSIALTDLFALPKGTFPQGRQQSEIEEMWVVMWNVVTLTASFSKMLKVRTSQRRRTLLPPPWPFLCRTLWHTRNPQGILVPRCHVSSCPFALRTGFSSPKQQITIIIRLGWTEAWLLLQNGRKAMWKGRWEGAGLTPTLTGASRGRSGWGKSAHWICKHTPLNSRAQEPLGKSSRRTHTPVRSIIINSQLHLNISQEEEPLFSLFLTRHYDF